MSHNKLANNMYCDFMDKYKSRLLHIQEEYNKQTDGSAILLIDFDAYVTGRNVDDSVFYCTKHKLPEYALAKVEEKSLKNMIALKHVGLCLITELSG